MLAAAAMVGAIVVTYLWEKRYGRIPPLPPGEGAENGDSRNAFRLRLLPIAAAIFTACIVATAFYSSFGTNWSAPIDSLLAYKNYVVRGTENGLHNNPWYFYSELLVAFHPSRGFVWSEGLIVALAVVGGIVSFMPNVLSGQQRTFGRFLAAYTLILTILYSAIPYKTPWCMLSFAGNDSFGRRGDVRHFAMGNIAESMAETARLWASRRRRRALGLGVLRIELSPAERLAKPLRLCANVVRRSAAGAADGAARPGVARWPRHADRCRHT